MGHWRPGGVAPPVVQRHLHEEGLVRKFTIGYVMDRDVGNSGGLGGAYGLLYAISKPLPFPEAQPWKISKRYKAFLFFGNLTSALKKRFGKRTPRVTLQSRPPQSPAAPAAVISFYFSRS